MSYVNPFGGLPQSPSQVSERAFDLDADLTLYWPWSNNNSADTTAKILDVTPDIAGWTITLPDARSASTGEAIIFRNWGAFSFFVVDADGGAVVTVAPSISQFVYILDNSTEAGSWSVIQFGAGASSVDAAALAGAGLKAIASMLAQDFPITELVTTYTVTTADRAKLFAVTGATGSGTLNLPDLASATNGFFIGFSNTGTGAWSIDPSGGETIDNASALSINPGESLFIVAASTNWYSVGRGRSTVFVQSRLNKNVAGSSDVTLTTTEASNIILDFYGILTGSINVIVPTAVQIYFTGNNTTGSFDLTVKTLAGTGVIIPQGERIIVHCDGTNVVDSDTVIPTSSFTMASGSVGAPGLPFTVDTDTGFYRPGENQLGIVAGATEIVRVDLTGLDVKSGELKIAGSDVMTLMVALS